MKNTFLGTLISGMAFVAVLACATSGGATTGGRGTPPAPDTQAEQLSADLSKAAMAVR
ncbi:MAG: hypothetical protein LBG27_03285 [Spirochaetaceae bacterium]|nr:hypothetical protein [Spirochaetaceae bacterium]